MALTAQTNVVYGASKGGASKGGPHGSSAGGSSDGRRDGSRNSDGDDNQSNANNNNSAPGRDAPHHRNAVILVTHSARDKAAAGEAQAHHHRDAVIADTLEETVKSHHAEQGDVETQRGAEPHEHKSVLKIEKVRGNVDLRAWDVVKHLLDSDPERRLHFAQNTMRSHLFFKFYNRERFDWAHMQDYDPPLDPTGKYPLVVSVCSQSIVKSVAPMQPPDRPTRALLPPAR
jgi:hypothetical protein